LIEPWRPKPAQRIAPSHYCIISSCLSALLALVGLKAGSGSGVWGQVQNTIQYSTYAHASCRLSPPILSAVSPTFLDMGFLFFFFFSFSALLLQYIQYAWNMEKEELVLWCPCRCCSFRGFTMISFPVPTYVGIGYSRTQPNSLTEQAYLRVNQCSTLLPLSPFPPPSLSPPFHFHDFTSHIIKNISNHRITKNMAQKTSKIKQKRQLLI
jgi:hypothetical protein